MEGLTRGYAARLVQEGITVNAVAPSLIETDMIRPRKENWPAAFRSAGWGRRRKVAQRRADGHRQRLHDRPDDPIERGHELHLTSPRYVRGI